MIEKNFALSLLILSCLIFSRDGFCTILDFSYFKPCPINLKTFTNSLPDLIHTIIEENQFGSEHSLQIHNGFGKSFDLDTIHVRQTKAHTHCDLFLLINPPNYTIIESRYQVAPLAGNSLFNTFIVLQVQEHEQSYETSRSLFAEGQCTVPECFNSFDVWNSLIIFINFNPNSTPDTQNESYFIYCSHCDISYKTTRVLVSGFTETSGYGQIRDTWNQLNSKLGKVVIPIMSTNRIEGFNYSVACKYVRRILAFDLTNICYPNYYLTELLAEYFNFTSGYELVNKAYRYPFRIDYGFLSPVTRGRLVFEEDSWSMVPFYCEPAKEMTIISKSPSVLLVDFAKSLTWSTIFLSYGTWGGIFYGLNGQFHPFSVIRILNGIIGGLGMLIRQETGGGELLSKIKHLNFIHAVMSLVAIILSTGYEGRVTSSVITPSPPYVYKDLTELLDNGFKFYASTGNQTTEAFLNRMLNEIYGTFFKRYGNSHRMLESFFVEKLPPQEFRDVNLDRMKTILLGDMSTRALTGPIATLTNEKYYVLALYMHHKYPEIRCHVIKDTIMEWNSYWNIYNRYSHQFASFMTRIQGHGFPDFSRSISDWVTTLATQRYDEVVHLPNKLSIGNLKEVFELYYYSVLITILVFVLENLSSNSCRKTLVNLIRWCWRTL